MSERLTVGSLNFGAPYGTAATGGTITAEDMYAAFVKLTRPPNPEWILIAPGGGIYKHSDLMTLVAPHLAFEFNMKPIKYEPTPPT